MQWNSYKSTEKTRRDKPVPRGVVSINDTTGAMRIGDGHTLLDDLEDVGGGSVSGGGALGIRAVRATYTHATPGIDAGLVIGTLAYGEKAVGVRVGVEEAWDGLWHGDPSPAGIKIGTTEDEDCISGGYFAMDVADAPADAPWTGLLQSFNVDNMDFLTSGTGYGPPEGMDIIVKIDDGEGADALATTGISHVVVFIQAGFV